MKLVWLQPSTITMEQVIHCRDCGIQFDDLKIDGIIRLFYDPHYELLVQFQSPLYVSELFVLPGWISMV